MDFNTAVELLKDYSGCGLLLEGLERVESDLNEDNPVPGNVRAAFNIVVAKMRPLFVGD